jgi:OTU domain-containing protein 6
LKAEKAEYSSSRLDEQPAWKMVVRNKGCLGELTSARSSASMPSAQHQLQQPREFCYTRIPPKPYSPYLVAQMADAPETLETLQTRQRKEQRDLVSRITQKKKQASKKTRKGVNDECERLEQDLKEKHDAELRALNGEVDEADTELEVESEREDDAQPGGVEEAVAKLSIGGEPQPQENGTGKKKKPNRQKARLARRAADHEAQVLQAEAEARDMPDQRTLEHSRMAPLLESHALSLHEIRADGHCLYAAVADQLATRGLDLKPKIVLKASGDEKAGTGYKAVRGAAADWIEANADDFAGFMEDPLPEHVRKIRDTGEWGGHLELLALAKTYGVRICVLHSDGRVDKIEDEAVTGDKEEIWLGYYRHSHGLGEHYNSLRKAEAA